MAFSAKRIVTDASDIVIVAPTGDEGSVWVTVCCDETNLHIDVLLTRRDIDEISAAIHEDNS